MLIRWNNVCLIVCFIGSFSVHPAFGSAAYIPANFVADKTIEETYSFEFQDISLDHALYLISVKTGTVFLYESMLTQNYRVSLALHDLRLREVLDQLLSPFGFVAVRSRSSAYHIRFDLKKKLPEIMFTAFPDMTRDCLFPGGSNFWMVYEMDTRTPLTDHLMNNVFFRRQRLGL